MNNYILAELSSTKNGGGSFNCKANFKLDNMPLNFLEVDVKIDTGCSLSTIPLKSLGISKHMLQTLKEKDIDNNLVFQRSYGVETGGTLHQIPITKHQKMSCKALKFKHNLSSFRINDVPIPQNSIYINYDRSGHILIGMDIIKQLFFVIDKSLITGKVTLIACPNTLINDDFREALKNHFNLDLTDI